MPILYDPTPVPLCVDTETIDTWLQNSKALADCALEINAGISCAPINGDFTSGCITVDGGRSTVDPGSVEATALDKKLTLGFVSITVPDVVEERESSDGRERFTVPGVSIFRATMVCDGVVVASSSAVTVQSFGTLSLNMVACCPRNSSIEICLSQIGEVLPYSATVCGALMCLEESYLRSYASLPSFCCPPPFIPAGCNVGRAGLHLLRQNLRALHALAAEGQNVIECPANVTLPGAGSQTIHTLAEDAVFLVVGNATVCVTTNSNSALSYTGGPSVSCAGVQTTCPITQGFPAITSDSTTNPRSACWNFPIVACGVCRAGDSIVAGFSEPLEECDTDIVDPNVLFGGRVDSVSQQYTVYLFRKTDPIAEGDLLPWINPRLLKCPERLQLELLIAQADALATYLDTVSANGSYCNATNGSSAGLLSYTVTQEIRPPFLPPPPPDPIPDKKTLVLGYIDICFTNTAQNTYALVNATVDITCGADTTQLMLDNYIDPIQVPGIGGDTSPGNNVICVSLPVQYTFACPITSPVEMSTTLTGPASVEATIKWDFIAFCP